MSLATSRGSSDSQLGRCQSSSFSATATQFGDRRSSHPSVRPASVERLARAFARTRPPARATARGRRAPGRSACRRRILAGGLAQLAASAFDVEDVVDDLKREADLGGIAVDGRHRRVVAAGHDRAAHRRRADQRAGLPRVHGAQPVGVERNGAWPAPCPAACRSIAWPPTMPIAPAASATTRTTRSLRADDRRIVAAGLARQQRERLGLQPVAGENRDAVAVDDVQRRPSAPQRVVVHRRQVVVDQRVGVDQLDRARGRQREIGCRGASAHRASRCRATASAAASASIGRSRLPPAKTL